MHSSKGVFFSILPSCPPVLKSWWLKSLTENQHYIWPVPHSRVCQPLKWPLAIKYDFVICDFNLPQWKKIPRKGHFNDLSNKYKIRLVPRRISSEKGIFDGKCPQFKDPHFTKQRLHTRKTCAAHGLAMMQFVLPLLWGGQISAQLRCNFHDVTPIKLDSRPHNELHSMNAISWLWACDLLENQHLGSRQLSKNKWFWWALNLSPQYGHTILVSRHLIFTGANWP